MNEHDFFDKDFNIKDPLFAVWMSLLLGAGNADFLKVLDVTGSFYAAFNAKEQELRELGVPERLCRILKSKDLTDAYRVMRYCKDHQVGVLIYGDEHYPSCLRSIQNPPMVLYWRGELPDFSKRLCVAMVGKRNMSAYGMETAYKIAYELAAAGAVVVSGMALGIDGVSACGALQAGGKTVALLGSGIDVIYPRQHETLMNAIVESGAVITEFAPGMPPSGYHFPIRNRLISALSQATLVVEADENSGAMITARQAIMQGRDIYAIPGNIGNRNATGTNSLIRDGASVVLCARDLVGNYLSRYRVTLNMAKLISAESTSAFSREALNAMRVCTQTVPEIATSQNDTLLSAIPAVPGRKKKQAGTKTDADRDGAVERKKKTAAEKGSGATENATDMHRSARETDALQYGHNAAGGSTAGGSTAGGGTVGDHSEEILQSLTPAQRRIFEEMPLDHAVTVDELMKSGSAMGEIIAALTILELKGLIQSLPGGLYTRI